MPDNTYNSLDKSAYNDDVTCCHFCKEDKCQCGCHHTARASLLSNERLASLVGKYSKKPSIPSPCCRKCTNEDCPCACHESPEGDALSTPDHDVNVDAVGDMVPYEGHELDSNGRMLIEAISGYLKEKAILGLPKSKPEEYSHTSQFRWESIKDEFALKVADSPFFESITSAFHAVHSYKYIDHPTFKIALQAEMKSRAIPTVEMDKALDAVKAIVEGLKEEKPSERDAGWNPQIKEIADMTRNADTYTPSKEPPFFGGGPWADKGTVSEGKYAYIPIRESNEDGDEDQDKDSECEDCGRVRPLRRDRKRKMAICHDCYETQYEGSMGEGASPQSHLKTDMIVLENTDIHCQNCENPNGEVHIRTKSGDLLLCQPCSSEEYCSSCEKIGGACSCPYQSDHEE